LENVCDSVIQIYNVCVVTASQEIQWERRIWVFV